MWKKSSVTKPITPLIKNTDRKNTIRRQEVYVTSTRNKYK